MLFYFLITGICALLMYYMQHNYRRIMLFDKNMYYINRNRILYSIPFIPLFLISALRYGIGTDYFYTYYPTFFRIRNGYELNHSMELGFLYLNKFVACFSDDVTWVIAICALIFFIFIEKAIIEQSENPTISLLLLVGTGLFQFSMNGMRQAVVIAVWFYSIKYVKHKKFFPFLICMLASSSFHLSALTMIPFYFLYNKIKLKPQDVVVIIVGTIAFSDVFKQLILWVAYFTKYYDKFIGTSQVEGNFAYSTFFIMLAVLVYLLLLYKRLNNIWEYNFFFISATIGTMCSLLTGEIYVIARMLVFFQYIPILFFPHTLKVFDRNSRKLITFIFIMFYFLSLWFMAGYLDKGETVPYQSIFNK